MILLQAAIGAGLILLAILAIALLIGIPLLTLLFIPFFKSKLESDNTNKNTPTDQQASSTPNQLYKKAKIFVPSVLLAFTVIIILFIIFIFILDIFIPSIE